MDAGADWTCRSWIACKSKGGRRLLRLRVMLLHARTPWNSGCDSWAASDVGARSRICCRRAAVAATGRAAGGRRHRGDSATRWGRTGNGCAPGFSNARPGWICPASDRERMGTPERWPGGWAPSERRVTLLEATRHASWSGWDQPGPGASLTRGQVLQRAQHRSPTERDVPGLRRGGLGGCWRGCGGSRPKKGCARGGGGGGGGGDVFVGARDISLGSRGGICFECVSMYEQVTLNSRHIPDPVSHWLEVVLTGRTGRARLCVMKKIAGVSRIDAISGA